MTTIENVERNLDAFRSEVNGRFEALQTEIRELTSALREQVRIDGEIKRVNDALARMGKQLDKLEERGEDADERLRNVEQSGAAHRTEVRHLDRLTWLPYTLVGSVLSGALVGIVVWAIKG